ncbi:hypothetical protein JCM24511_00276 [Saitozyma sp. JCM 24511]|nr:hypothetical protein JCM24511_00276 [Saitozyma sp. JCM 24511]
MRLQGAFAGWTVRIEDRKAKRLNEYRPAAVSRPNTTSEPPGMECFVECEGDEEFAVVIERPTRPSGLAADDIDSRGADTALYLFADG